MITTAIIAFREFLEAFLIVGVFLGISRKLRLGREREIWLASICGVLASAAITIAIYLLGAGARNIINEEKADLLEGFLLVFSSLFIVYVVFSLHNLIQNQRSKYMRQVHEKLQSELFDVSLFLTIMFLVVREGFEIALFSASVSLFATFIQNVSGLFIGFLLSALCGLATYYAYESFPIEKVFRFTEYLIIFVGSALIQHGITIISGFFFHVDLSRFGYFGLSFLPDEDTFAGHLLQGLAGIDREFSLMRLIIMILYVGFVYLVFMKGRVRQAGAR